MLKIGSSSVYFSWTVSVEAQTEKDVGNNAHPKQVNASQTIGEDRKKGFSIKEQMALEQKAAEKAKQQADAEVKAAKEAKAEADAEMKAAKEIEAQANADAKAAKEIKAQADEEIKTVQKARAKVDADATALAKKAEELERIAKRAKNIDFVTLGIATANEKDDLQAIKGVGPFIAEKLNALGIFTFGQVGNMNPEIEEQVNVAIEFFSGRIKRDEWAKQARELEKGKTKV
jgi:predicted flap endonuclease-1-like 5' DNA nuclease